MTHRPLIVRRVRCPRCRSTSTRVYSSAVEDGITVQYRRCVNCEGAFKTVLEPEDPNPTKEANGTDGKDAHDPTP